MKGRLALLASFLLLVTAIKFAGVGNPTYAVLEPRHRIAAAGRSWSARQAAERFAPVVQGEAPASVWYEPLPSKGARIAIVYRLAWPDETHPVAFIDAAYRAFRKLWFAGTEDLEYVWLEADLDTEHVTRIAFERPEVGKVLVGHLPVVLEKGQFPVDGGRPVLRVASWNHLFETGTPGDGAAPGELTWLDDEAFRRLRVGRRSQPPRELLPDPGI